LADLVRIAERTGFSQLSPSHPSDPVPS